jgi:hypothetical protein
METILIVLFVILVLLAPLGFVRGVQAMFGLGPYRKHDNTTH